MIFPAYRHVVAADASRGGCPCRHQCAPGVWAAVAGTIATMTAVVSRNVRRDLRMRGILSSAGGHNLRAWGQLGCGKYSRWPGQTRDQGSPRHSGDDCCGLTAPADAGLDQADARPRSIKRGGRLSGEPRRLCLTRRTRDAGACSIRSCPPLGSPALAPRPAVLSRSPRGRFPATHPPSFPNVDRDGRGQPFTK